VHYEVEINGRVRLVAVHRDGGHFAASVDGRVRRVDVARIDAQNMSLVVDDGAATYDIGVAGDAATGLLQVRVGATVIDVAINGGRRRRPDHRADAGAGPQRIVAPMPEVGRRRKPETRLRGDGRFAVEREDKTSLSRPRRGVSELGQLRAPPSRPARCWS
jgi:hypothetical protein